MNNSGKIHKLIVWEGGWNDGDDPEDWDADQYVLASTPEDPLALNALLLEHNVQLNKSFHGFTRKGARTVDDLFVEIAVEGLSTLWIVSEMATSRRSFNRSRGGPPPPRVSHSLSPKQARRASSSTSHSLTPPHTFLISSPPSLVFFFRFCIPRHLQKM